MSATPAPQSDAAILASLQPDDWGLHGPNQTIDYNEKRVERNNVIWMNRRHVFSGVTINTGRVRST